MRNVYDFDDGPLEIRSGIQILDVDINIENSAISMAAFFQFFWKDSRIKILNANEIDVLSVSVDENLIESIWLPDFYFYDLRFFEKHELFRDVQGGIQLRGLKSNETG